MNKLIETSQERERTVLVCFSVKGDPKHYHPEDSLNELKFLAETAGANVVKTYYQQRDSFDSKYLIGKGKAQEIAEYVETHEIKLVIFENELGYSQLRNLEQKIKCKIIDKSNLILDIFAANARTSQAKLQVELAQLEYLLPRLTRQWTHLSKQFGGIGTKGPGETQIETDRRLIRNRISSLKEKLKKIDTQARTQSSERSKYFRISLVGYTNVGKSTLLNTLTNANVLVEDKLFATLDTSTKILRLTNIKADGVTKFPKKVLISDTVGFIKNLPHGLIESFKSTLSEAVESDILLHVIDISNPHYEDQIETVEETLKQIDADKKNVVRVYNKVDKFHDPELFAHIKEQFPHSVFISAEKGLNVNALVEMIKDILTSENKLSIFEIEAGDYKKLSEIYESSEVHDVKYHDDKIEVTLRTSDKRFLKPVKTKKDKISK
ncbi:MAG TPA: GTPase HflX [Ignavibacteria bacterium]|nr:GTPase HflX [Ignavibacteria bacterium]